MFDKLKEEAKLNLEKKSLDGNHMDFSKKDWYSKGYWDGYIEGLDIAERQIKSDRKYKIKN